MKLREIPCILLAFIIFPYQPPPLHATDTDTNSKLFVELDRERAEAQVKKDFAVLDRLLADDLTYIHASGLVQGKAEFIADLRSNKRAYSSIKNSDVTVRRLKGAVVITARSDIHLVHDGKDNELPLRVTEVYAKRKGGWQLIAYQSTRLTP
jgi:hypothetical protein